MWHLRVYIYIYITFTPVAAMARNKNTSRPQGGLRRPKSTAPARVVFEQGESRLRLDDLFSAVTLEEGEVEGEVTFGALTFPPTSARVLGWTLTVTSVNPEVQFRTGVGHAKVAKVSVPCTFPRPASVGTPAVRLVGPEGTTFGVFCQVTVFYKAM
jgi:hypothetical protein